MARTYTSLDADTIRRTGTRMVKVKPIWVTEPLEETTQVHEAGGGWKVAQPGDRIASNGEEVWVLGQDFIDANYRAEPAED